MSNYLEYNDKVAFHPGYYLKEIIEDSGLTQRDFARRLGTTPKNLNVILSGEQRISIDIATKLSKMLCTTVAYWLNLQQTFDEIKAEYILNEELKKEREIFQFIDYAYFRDNFKLPDLSRKIDEQIVQLRSFLKIASLSVLGDDDLTVSFRSYTSNLSKSNIVNANAMVQIAINKAINVDAPSFNKRKFEKAIDFALTQTRNHSTFLPEIREVFLQAGVVLVVLPNLKNSGITGATKRVNGKVMLMVNDRRHYSDTFWFTLFHEIAHVMASDYGVTFKDNKNKLEDDADSYAQQKLIPEDKYEKFVSDNVCFNETTIRYFADEINRDPGIVLGRLQYDKKVPFSDKKLSDSLRFRYNISID